MKKINEYPMWVQTLAIPFLYIIMIIKVLEAIPILVITRCNTIIDKVNHQETKKQ